MRKCAAGKLAPRGLRHGFGVGALHSGAPLHLIQRWMGHARLSTTAIYMNVSGPEELHFMQKFWRSRTRREWKLFLLTLNSFRQSEVAQHAPTLDRRRAPCRVSLASSGGKLPDRRPRRRGYPGWIGNSIAGRTRTRGKDGGSGLDSREPKQRPITQPRDIYALDLHSETLKVKVKNFW